MADPTGIEPKRGRVGPDLNHLGSSPRFYEASVATAGASEGYPTDCLIEPFAYAYLIFGFAIPVQISQQLTP